MVVSRAANSHTPTIKEALTAGGRTMTQRVSELPSLSLRERLGFGASTPSPLTVKVHVAPTPERPARRLTARYSRSFTDDLDVATPAEAREGRRRVRFDLPPKTPSFIASATVFGSGSLTKQPAQVAGVDSWLRSRSGVPTFDTSTSRSATTRVHDTGRYRRGTLPPTSHTAPPGVAGPAPTVPGALLRAAREGDEDALKKYLGLGGAGIPDDVVNATDSSGRTVVSYVVSTGSLPILEALVQTPGLDINQPDNEGNTPLHFGAQAGQVEALNFILSRCSSVEVDARNALGFTPLMKAALQGRTKCAKLLLFAGASPSLRDCGRGLRAEQWARYCGRYVCAEVIEKFSRHRLLDRTTSNGRWGSEPELGTKLLTGGKLPSAQPQQSTGFKSKIKRAFRTNSSSDSGNSKQRFSLVSQLTSAALCASSPVLPASNAHSSVRSMIRPLAVPKVQVTPAAPVVGTPDPPGSMEATREKRPPTNKTSSSSSSSRQIILKKK